MTLHGIPILALAAAMLLSVGCAKRDFSEEKEQLETNQALWLQHHVSNYSIFSIRTCYCEHSDVEVLIAVENKAGTETITSISDTQHGEPLQFGESHDDAAHFLTIEEMFEKIEVAITQRVEEIKVTYDDEFGFPTSIFIDYSKNTMDDEFTLKTRKSTITTSGV